MNAVEMVLLGIGSGILGGAAVSAVLYWRSMVIYWPKLRSRRHPDPQPGQAVADAFGAVIRAATRLHEPTTRRPQSEGETSMTLTGGEATCRKCDQPIPSEWTRYTFSDGTQEHYCACPIVPEPESKAGWVDASTGLISGGLVTNDPTTGASYDQGEPESFRRSGQTRFSGREWT